MGRDSARERIARLTQVPAPLHAPAPPYAPTPVHAPAPAHVPAKTPPRVRLHCYVDQDQMDFLERLRTQQDVDKAVIVRHIIDFYREHGPLK